MAVIDVIDIFPPRQLFASEQEAHDEVMRVAISVYKEIIAAGHRPPSFKQFDRDTRELFEVFRLFAPREYHGETKAGTQH